MGVGHAPNLGADPVHFLWQLRHNTENSLLNSLLAGNLTLKNWRRIATRYDRYAQNYLSGLALAVIMIAWI
jgi:transposase